MFLKKGHSLLIALVFFLLGAIISYIACQYEYLDIKTEFNVVELLLSIGTIGIGLYIALILDKNRKKSQNFYAYVEGKYDALWEAFIQFSEVIEFSTNVELAETAKWFKLINQKLTPLIKVVESFEYDPSCLTNIENKIDELEVFISENNHIENGVIDLSMDKETIVQDLNQINELFAISFKELTNV